jgi:hypothetical protein
MVGLVRKDAHTMWWKTQKESESPFRSMALGFLKDRRDVQFEGHCATCDAFQPVYFEALVEAHGKTAIFRDIVSVRFIAD